VNGAAIDDAALQFLLFFSDKANKILLIQETLETMFQLHVLTEYFSSQVLHRDARQWRRRI